MKNESENYEFIGKMVGQTDMAILFQEETCTKDESVWLPKSQIKICDEDKKTGEIEIMMPVWLAIERGMA